MLLSFVKLKLMATILNYFINMEKIIINLLRIRKEKKEISCETYNNLYPAGSTPGIWYGLSKKHNPDLQNLKVKWL